MGKRIYDTIREIIETTPGLTQKGLAERMELNPAAVNRMLYGRRNIMAEEIPAIEDYLGVKLELSAPAPTNLEYRQAVLAGPRRGLSDIDAPGFNETGIVTATARGAIQMVPVYGGGAINLQSSRAVDWAPRPPALFGIPDGFAIYVSSDDMEPRYFRGELVYIHPGRPLDAQRDCLVEMEDGTAHLRRFIHQSGDRIRVAQFNPARETDLARKSVKAVYSVVGRG